MTFYAEFSKYYDAIFPAKEAQLVFLRQLFGAEDVERVLDVACGTGNYALELSKWGFDVTGYDLEPSMIRQAQAKADQKAHASTFSVEDMRSLPVPKKPFDAVLCIGNSLAHLLDQEELLSTVRGFLKQLRLGGICIIQLVNYNRILDQNQAGLPTIDNQEEGVALERQYVLRRDGLIDFRTVLKVRSGKEMQEYHNVVILNPLRKEQLHAILDECGFGERAYFGDFKGSPFGEESPALVVVAKSQQSPS